MGKQEAYEILELNENATPEEVKTAFNRLIKKNHPDVGGSGYFAVKLVKAKEILLKEGK
jgi:DnaJ-class molecular chaperone